MASVCRVVTARGAHPRSLASSLSLRKIQAQACRDRPPPHRPPRPDL